MVVIYRAWKQAIYSASLHCWFLTLLVSYAVTFFELAQAITVYTP